MRSNTGWSFARAIQIAHPFHKSGQAALKLNFIGTKQKQVNACWHLRLVPQILMKTGKFELFSVIRFGEISPRLGFFTV